MNEEFVPFELAKKLQEKGFDWQTFDRYDHLGNFNKGFIPRTLRGCPMHREYYAPTIGLAMKWLREEKKLHIELWTVGKKPIKWGHTITMLNHVGEKQGWSSGERGDSYEAAAIAGIEYCVDNII